MSGSVSIARILHTVSEDKSAVPNRTEKCAVLLGTLFFNPRRCADAQSVDREQAGVPRPSPLSFPALIISSASVTNWIFCLVLLVSLLPQPFGFVCRHGLREGRTRAWQRTHREPSVRPPSAEAIDIRVCMAHGIHVATLPSRQMPCTQTSLLRQKHRFCGPP